MLSICEIEKALREKETVAKIEGCACTLVIGDAEIEGSALIFTNSDGRKTAIFCEE